MAMKMFMNMKLSMIKDLSERIEKENLMTDDLKIFLEKELDDIKDNGKMMCKSMNRLNKKRANSSTTEESDESDETTGSKKKLKKEKRPPTEHQSRVSKCMVVLKERYSQVKHQIRLGTANYMATFIKNEFTDIDFNTELDKVEQALAESIKRMNEKKQSDVYPVTPEASAANSEESDEKKENKKPVAATEEPFSSKTKNTSDKKQKNKKENEKESMKKVDDEDEEKKEVERETKEQKKQKMDDLLKELEEMNDEEESDEEEESDDDDE
jgi:hypothetical protein